MGFWNYEIMDGNCEIWRNVRGGVENLKRRWWNGMGGELRIWLLDFGDFEGVENESDMGNL